MNHLNDKDNNNDLNNVDIGVYPLINNDFNSFKCGFKALEYRIEMIIIIITVNKDILF